MFSLITNETCLAMKSRPFTSVSKRVLVHNLSHGNDFYSQVHFHANETHFHFNGFALGLVLKQR